MECFSAPSCGEDSGEAGKYVVCLVSKGERGRSRRMMCLHSIFYFYFFVIDCRKPFLQTRFWLFLCVPIGSDTGSALMAHVAVTCPLCSQEVVPACETSRSVGGLVRMAHVRASRVGVKTGLARMAHVAMPCSFFRSHEVRLPPKGVPPARGGTCVWCVCETPGCQCVAGLRCVILPSPHL